MRYSFGDYLLDEKTGSVTNVLKGEELKLRPQTYRLLEVLVKNYPKIMPRDQLLDLVWGTDHVSSGSLPQAISELRQKLGDDPQQAKFISTVHRRGYRFVSPVSVASTMIFLRPEVEKALKKQNETPTRTWKRHLPMVAVSALALLTVLGSLTFAHWMTQQPDLQPGSTMVAESGPRTAIAVVGFRDLAADPETAWLSTALAEMFATELALDERLRIVSNSSIMDVTADLEAGSLAEVSKIRLRLGIDLLVMGNYLLLSDHPAQLRLDLRLIDAQHQQTLLTLSETTQEADLLNLVSRLGDRLRGQLGAGASDRMMGTVEPGETRITRPMRLYFESQAASQRFDPTTARELLSQASSLDPRSPRIARALAAVLLDLGEEGRAHHTLLGVRDQFSTLAEEERLASEGLFFELSGDRAAALNVFRDLSQRFPDQPEHALSYAKAQIFAGQSQEMLEELEKLRKRFQIPAVSVRLDLLEAQAAASISELERQEEAARRAIQVGRELGSPWLTGRALLATSQAVGRQGDLNQALTLAEEARTLFAKSQDQHQVSAALNELAMLHFKLGQLESSRQVAEQALDLSTHLKNQRERGFALRCLAQVAFYSGRTEEGRERLRQAEDLYLATGDRLGRAGALALESEMLLHQGDVASAINKNTEALGIFGELEDRYQQAASQQMEGNLLARLSRFDQALSSWEKASKLFREVGDRRGEVETSSRIAGIYTARGQLREARELLTQALAYQRSTGSLRDTARTLYDLALIDLPTGRPEQAKAALQEALQIFEQIGDQLGLCFLQRKMGDVLYHLGEIGPSRQRLEEALTTCRTIDHRIGEALAINNLGFVALVQDRLDEARKLLEQARLLHAAMGDVGNEATDRFGLAWVELAAGDLRRADREVSQAIDVYAEKDSPDLLTLARALRSRILMDLKRPDEAQALIEEASVHLSNDQNVLRSLDSQLQILRVQAGLDPGSDASRTLQELATRARALGYRLLAFEARFAELESGALQSKELRQAAEEFAKEAETVGFALLARKARTLATASS